MLGRKKHPFAGYPAAKHPKRRKASELFLLFNTRVDFGLRNNSANSSSVAKVSVPVHNYNFLVKARIYRYEQEWKLLRRNLNF